MKVGLPLFGILNVFKPAGMTSRDVVDRVARLARPVKAGHAGTLDPMATGVLVVCVGRATRLIELIQKHPKSYRARFLLGRQSDTDDVTGNVTELPDARTVCRAELEALLPAFVGRISQKPPAFSAVHVEGVRAYKLARRGEAVDLEPRPVDIHRLALTEFSYPEIELTIDCGSGTYVRAIGRDLGQMLGCGAVMSALVRTRIGPYAVEDSAPLERLIPQAIEGLLLPPKSAAVGFAHCVASPEDVERIRTGRSFEAPNAPLDAVPGAMIAVLDATGELLCLAEHDAPTDTLVPKRVFIS